MARFKSRLPASLYVAGPFAMGYTEFYNFLIPLYGLSLVGPARRSDAKRPSQFLTIFPPAARSRPKES